MIWAIRSFALTAGAAALLSSQAVYAAPARMAPAIDPLVSLSVLGTAQSRAAVCAAGASAAAAGAATAFGQAPATGCLFPVVTPTTPPPVVDTPLPSAPPPAGPGFNPLLGILGALLLAGLAFAILSGDDNDGDLEPISPA